MTDATIKSIAGFSGAFIALLIALIGAYLALDRKVTVLAEAAMTPIDVEHIIDLKTTDKLTAIQASLARIESNIQRLQDAERGARTVFDKGDTR